MTANAPLCITKGDFDQCYAEIQEWLDIPAMQGHLMKHGLLVTSNDLHHVKKIFSPQEHLNYVYGKAQTRQGGFHRLYLSIRESQDMHMGHKDAADVLEKYARERPRPPASRSTSCPSTTSDAPSTASSADSTTSYPPSTISSSTPSSDSFPPPQSQLSPPSAYQLATSGENLVTLENRSCSSRESMVAGQGGAGRLSQGRLGMNQRPSSIYRSQSNEEGTIILKNCSPMSLHNTRGPYRQESAVADLDPEVELDQASSPRGSQPPPLSPSPSSLSHDSDSTVLETGGREYIGDSSLPPIQDLLTTGDFKSFYKFYHGNGYDIEFADSDSELFQSVAHFLVAVFNSRDREGDRKGIFITGVNVSMTPPVITGVTVAQDNFLQHLKEELKKKVGIHDNERELSEAELGCVEHEFTVTQSGATLLCVFVSPSWEACEGSLYYCREGEGKRYWRQVDGQLLFHRIEEHATLLQSLWQH